MRHWKVALALVPFVVLCSGAASAASQAPPFDYVHGRALRFGSGIERLGQLRWPLFAPLLGQEAALAITSPTRGQILYHAWDGPVRGAGVPVLGIHDREGGPDRVLARGAQSAAWRRDGAIAYMQAARARNAPTPSGTFGGQYGQVVVRRAPAAPPRRWTFEQARRYVVLGWARSTLLVEIVPSHLRQRDTRHAGVFALDGPRRLRALPLRQLVAISPDGRRAIGSYGVGDGPARSLRLVDVATGRMLDEHRLNGIGGLGDWFGDRVVAPTAFGRLVIVRVSGGRITFARRLSAGRGSPVRPVFVAGGRSVVVHLTTLDSRDRPTYVGFASCERTSGRCRRGPNLLPPATRWAAVIDNASRPRR